MMVLDMTEVTLLHLQIFDGMEKRSLKVIITPTCRLSTQILIEKNGQS